MDNEYYIYDGEYNILKTAKFLFVTDSVENAVVIDSLGYKAIYIEIEKGNPHKSADKLIEKYKEYGSRSVLMLLFTPSESMDGTYLDIKNYIKKECMSYYDGCSLTTYDRYPSWLRDIDSFSSLLNGYRNEFVEYLNYRTTSALSHINKETSIMIKPKNAITDLDYYEIEIAKHSKRFKTGFDQLDNALGGGAYEGLTVIGAISSAGKTSFMLQMCDQFAKNGYDVLYYSLEMSKYDLITKSLSRLSYNNRIDTNIALSVFDIQNGIANKSFTKEQQKAFDLAKGKYTQYASHVYFCDSIYSISAIKLDIGDFIREEKRTPVVIIDYLQIIEPSIEYKCDAKAAMDSNIKELKKISKDNNVPIIAISSFNRNSYNSEISLSSFKESGMIEYGSDLVLGLQPNAKDKEAVTLKILKQRNGVTSDIKYKFVPEYSYFYELDKEAKEHGERRHIGTIADKEKAR